jgi:hypothetical protein
MSAFTAYIQSCPGGSSLVNKEKMLPPDGKETHCPYLQTYRSTKLLFHFDEYIFVVHRGFTVIFP